MKAHYLPVAIVVLLTSAFAHAQNWRGTTSGDWDTTGNWDTGTLPTNAATATFTSGSYNTSVSLSTASTARGVIFGTSALAYTIGGNYVLTLDKGGTLGGYVQSQTTATETFDLDVTFLASTASSLVAGGVDFTSTSAGTITFAAGHTLTMGTNTQLTIGGSSTAAGIVNINGALVNTTAGAQLNNSGMTILNFNPTSVTGSAFQLRSTGSGTVNVGTSSGSSLYSIGLGGISGTAAGAVYVTADGVSLASNISMGNATAGTLTIGSNISGAGGTATLTGTIALASAAGNTMLQQFDVAANNTLKATGVVSGTQTGTQVKKTGAGTLVFSGANTYAASTSVSAGTFLANNTSGSATGSGAVTVASGATLGGSGILNPTGSNVVTVQSGGILAPGTAGSTNILTLNASGNTTAGLLTLTGATLSFNLGTGNTASELKLTSAFAGEVAGLSGNTISFTDLTNGNLATGKYTLILTDLSTSGNSSPFSGLSLGTLSGFTITGLNGATAQLELNSVGGVYAFQLDVTAVAVPEPRGTALLFTGAVLAAVCFWRRGMAA